MSQTPNYRVYFLDGMNSIVRGEWVDANTLEKAISVLRKTNPSGAFEIWDRNRLVSRIEAKRLKA